MQLVIQTTNLGETLANKLTMALQSHTRVVWLVPGGSNIPISIEAMGLLDEQLTNKLVIMQTDERFVDVTSPDCNWYQLQTGGFDTKQATTYPFLVAGENRDQTVERYGHTVQSEFAQADYIIGQFGFGSDGHVAGIKPHSAASTTDALTAGYQAEDFNRITLTFAALRQLNEAVAFAHGDSKRPVLEQFVGDAPPLERFPAGILKQIDNSTVYNDQIETPKGTE